MVCEAVRFPSPAKARNTVMKFISWIVIFGEKSKCKMREQVVLLSFFVLSCFGENGGRLRML